MRGLEMRKQQEPGKAERLERRECGEDGAGGPDR